MKKKVFYLTFMLLCLFMFKNNANAGQFINFKDNSNNIGRVNYNESGGAWYNITPYHYVQTGFYDYYVPSTNFINSTRFGLLFNPNITSKLDIKNSYINFIGSVHSEGNSLEFALSSFFLRVTTDNKVSSFTCNVSEINSIINSQGSEHVVSQTSAVFNIGCYIDELTLQSYSVIDFNLYYVSHWNGATAYNVVFRFQDAFFLSSNSYFQTSDNSDIKNALDNLQETTKNEADETQEKLDETNKQLGDLNDNITNSDTSEANDTAGGFFSNFSVEDHGGISGIITAPLKFVKTMTDTCKPIEFEIFDTKISLPCGDTLFWNKAEVQEFRATWNCIFGGAILYALCIKLFKVIEGLKNPDDSRIEVMKL